MRRCSAPVVTALQLRPSGGTVNEPLHEPVGEASSPPPVIHMPDCGNLLAADAAASLAADCCAMRLQGCGQPPSCDALGRHVLPCSCPLLEPLQRGRAAAHLRRHNTQCPPITTAHGRRAGLGVREVPAAVAS